MRTHCTTASLPRTILAATLLAATTLVAPTSCSKPSPSSGQATHSPNFVSQASPRHAEPSRGLSYLNEHSISVTRILEPPPAPGSEESGADLSRMENLQDSRTPQQCERANSEVGATPGEFFGPPYGPLTEEELARWSPLLEKAARDTSFFVGKAKAHWMRPRPYQEDSRLKPCVPLDSSSAYPSGHATLARVFADILDTLLPDQKHQIDRRARQIARDRVLGGVHHPTDVAAGGTLGDAVFNALMIDPAFLRDLRDAAATGPRQIAYP